MATSAIRYSVPLAVPLALPLALLRYFLLKQIKLGKYNFHVNFFF